MITEDVKLLNDIFAIVNEGIDEDYDSFLFRTYIYDGYSVELLQTTLNGQTNSTVKKKYNGAVVSKYLKALRNNARTRGEEWCGLVMSYTKGGKVNVTFEYKYPEDHQPLPKC